MTLCLQLPAGCVQMGAAGAAPVTIQPVPSAIPANAFQGPLQPVAGLAASLNMNNPTSRIPASSVSSSTAATDATQAIDNPVSSQAQTNLQTNVATSTSPSDGVVSTAASEGSLAASATLGGEANARTPNVSTLPKKRFWRVGSA
jgi:hypothetical protein